MLEQGDSVKPNSESKKEIKPTDLRCGLVVLQPTNFCNIDCKYCYLPDRDSYHVMQPTTIERIAQRVFKSPFFPEEANLLWHAGEPLTVPISFYENAIEIFERLNSRRIKLNWCIQTNGTVINPAWCEFFKKHDFDVGVSIDGPEGVHDSMRVDRKGRGTFKKVVRGIKLLREHGIDYGILATIGRQAIKDPDKFWQFLIGNQITRVGLNEEEITGTNKTSSLDYGQSPQDYSRFLSVLWQNRENQQTGSVRIRELDRMVDRIFYANSPIASDLLRPFTTLSFDYLGNMSTFSPELLGLLNNEYSNFSFGNVYKNSIEDMFTSLKFQKVYSDIQAGVEKCKETCRYFGVCGGGNPSTKLGEHGTFNATETLNCRLSVKTVFDVVSQQLENQLKSNNDE